MGREDKPGDWVLEAFTRGGVDTVVLQRLQPKAVAQVLSHPDAISPADVNRLLLTCAKLSKNPDFGLDMVKLVDLSMYGTYAYLLENADTVDEFFRIAQSYYPMFYQGATIEYIKDSKFLRLRFCVDDAEGICSRHDNEWTLAFFADFLQRKIGAKHQVLIASFNNAEPKTLKRQHDTFGKKLLFNQSLTELVYPKSMAKTTLNYSDPELLLVLREHADKLLTQLGESNSFSNSVRLLINDELEDSNIKATDIAKKLTLSLSVMKRKLASENTNFRTLKQAAISDLARKLLRQSSSSIGDIATRLGYSDQSAFSRVFRRNHGVSPKQYRETSV